MKLTMILFLLAALAGCASKGPAVYDAYLAEKRAERAQESLDAQANDAAAAAMAASCAGDKACIAMVSANHMATKAFGAIARAGGAGSGGIAPPPRERDWAEKAHSLLSGASPILGTAVNAWVAKEQSDNNTRVSLGQQQADVEQWRSFAGFGNAAVGAVGDVASAGFDAFAGLPPTTQVGGDLISGTQHNGDSIGRDAIGGSQHVGDAIGGDAVGGDQRLGDDIGRDVIGGDRIADSNVGDGNRIGSDGPFDTDNSGQCTGERCQGDGDVVPLPEPEPEGPTVGPPGG